MIDDDENSRVAGMADAHECAMTAYRKALDAIDFTWEVEKENSSDFQAEKLSYARSVLAVMMELFDDEYYRVIERVKDDTQELG
jgi:flavin-dependent dehydrogenase